MKRSILLTSSLLLFTFSFSAAGYEVTLENRALNPVRFAAPETTEAVTLVKDGHVAFAIVADTNQERRVHAALRSITPAVTRLQKFVAQATGERPEVHASALDVPAGKAILFIGKSADTVRLGIDASKLPPEGFVVKTVGGTRSVASVAAGTEPGPPAGQSAVTEPGQPAVALVGNDCPEGRRRPTVFAVYDFMERAFGMRFYYPGPDGTLVPKLTDVVLPPCKYTDAPRFRNRGTYYMTLNAEGVALATGGRVTDEDITDFSYADRWSKTDSFTSMHSPFPEEWARANSNKIDIAFFRNPNGHLYFNPKGHAGNYFDVTNLKFADALVESCHRYYDSKGRDRQGFSYNDDRYITFGQCDAEVNLEEMQNTPVVRELGLITEENVKAGTTGYFSDIYGRFYKYLGERLLKEFPDKKLVVMPYSSYVLPPFQKKYRPPKNVEVGVCLAGAPRFFGNGKIRAEYIRELRDWYVALGNRPVQQLWTYNAWNNAFATAVATEGMGEFIRTVGETLGDIEVFHEFHLWPCAPEFGKWATQCNFYPGVLAGMRAFWNPAFDYKAALDEHWEPFYGKEAGGRLRKAHEILRESFAKYAVPKKAAKPLYPPAVLDALEAEFDAAEKATKPGTVEHRRFETYSKLLRHELKCQRGQHAYVVPRADARRFAGDWSAMAVAKMMDPLGTGDEPKVKPELRLGWDEKGLRGRLVTPGRPIVNEGSMWRGDVVEIFVCPGTDKAAKYQVFIDAKGRSGGSRQVVKPIVMPTDYHWTCAGLEKSVTVGEKEWTLEFFLPFSAFGQTPKAYDSWHFCLVYNRQETPAASTCMNLGNNHNVERYGLLRFLGLGD